MRICKAMGIACLLSTAALAAVTGVPVTEDFERGAAELRKDGWIMSSICSLTADRPKSGRQCLKVHVPDARTKYAALFIPVEQGKCYRAQVLVRCKDVREHPNGSQNRGAVIFCQWASPQKKWEPGGTFPKGLYGTHDWTLREVPLVRPIPARVGYIHLLLGVEGAGTAWFDDLKIEELTHWDGVTPVSPKDGATVDVRLPLLQWRSKAQRIRGARIELSRDPAFPPGGVLHVDAEGWQCRAPALTPGKWHWRIRVGTGEGYLPPSRARTFTVSDSAPLWPPTIRPVVKWSESTMPTLEARIRPKEIEAQVAVTIAGQPAQVLASERGTVRFKPKEQLPAGCHPVRIDASIEGRTESLSTFYCNKEPGCRVTIRDDNILLVDGKPFFPIGAYRDPSDTLTDFSGLLEAGFSVTHNYSFETPRKEHDAHAARRYLRAAHKHGIKVFMGLSRRKMDAGDDAWVQRWVAELMDEPGLLTWYLRDEPDGCGIPPSRMRQLSDLVKSVDPFHPTSLVCCIPGLFKRYGDTADIFWSDPYPIPRRPLTMVLDHTRASREAAGPNRPVWIVPQGFDWTYLRDTKRKLKELGAPTRPTAAETRCMAYMALAGGANGLIWYWSPNSILHIQRDAPEVWQGICATGQELRSLMPFLVARRTPEDLLDAPEPFVTWSRQANGKRVLAIVNTSPVPQTLSLNLHPFGVQSIKVRSNGTPVRLKEGELVGEFRGHEVKVYQW